MLLASARTLNRHRQAAQEPSPVVARQSLPGLNSVQRKEAAEVAVVAVRVGFRR